MNSKTSLNSKSSFRPAWLVALVAGLFAGCGPPAAPSFALKNLKGEVVTLESTRSRVTVLYFWAAWSPPSRLGLVQVSRLQRAYASRGLALVTVTVADDPVQTARVVKGMGPALVVLAGDDGIARDYFPGGDLTLPLTLVLDPRGRVAARLPGYQTADDLRPAVELALAKAEGRTGGGATIMTASH